MKKNRFALFMILALALAMLTGCGGGEDTSAFPVIEVADISTMNLEEMTSGSLTIAYPAENWIPYEATPGIPVLYLAETIETNQAVNINVQAVSKYGLPLTTSVMETVIEEVRNTQTGLTVDNSEMRMFNGKPVIYMQTTTQLTDELLDMMVEQGVYTEADYEAIGGREVLLSAPPTRAVMIYAVVDGWLCLYTGSYFSDATYDVVLDAMNVIIQTTSVA